VGTFYLLLHSLPGFEDSAAFVTLAAVVCAVAGPRRLEVLPICSLGLIVFYPDFYDTGMLTQLAAQEHLESHLLLLRDAMLALSYFYAWVLLFEMRRSPNSMAGRHPFLCWSSLIVGLAAVGSMVHGLSRLVLWTLVEQLGLLYWFVGYAILDQKSKKRSSLWVQLGTFYTFWGVGSALPIGKGAANLRQTGAADDEQLAVTQIKALKLMVLCVLISIVRGRGLAWIYGPLHVPTFGAAFRAQLAGRPYAVGWCWASVLAGFFKRIMKFAAYGNACVAIGRLSGFRLLQFTYKPCAARSVAEFWNRYNYYFKELLVDFFFFPTFVRFLKGQGWRRLALATFMAATVGNLIAHLLLTLPTLALAGCWAEFGFLQSYSFYCVALTAALIVSQLRLIRRSLGPPILGIGLFYCLLYVFDETFPEVSLANHLRFLLHLFGM
jgi:hypothetical protein